MFMIPQRRKRVANSAGWLLSTLMLLVGLTTACSHRSSSHRSSVTQTPQDTYQAAVNEEIFTVCEVPPSFPGGNDRISGYLRQNLRYPEEAIKAKVQGRVFVSFIVTKEGQIKGVTVLKGYDHGINDEAVRLIQTMPNWIPGKQSGHPVNVKYNLVVPFELASVK
jgi:protein TonB